MNLSGLGEVIRLECCRRGTTALTAIPWMLTGGHCVNGTELYLDDLSLHNLKFFFCFYSKTQSMGQTSVTLCNFLGLNFFNSFFFIIYLIRQSIKCEYDDDNSVCVRVCVCIYIYSVLLFIIILFIM